MNDEPPALDSVSLHRTVAKSVHPWMTEEETAFLAEHIRRTDRVFEWGAGSSTLWLAARCRRLTSVEHNPFVTRTLLQVLPDNVSLLHIPPEQPFSEGKGDDGDLDTFRSYTEAYTGKGIDVVLIDGRARVACARQVAEIAQYAPHPGLKVFIHDANREEYQRIWVRDDKRWGREFLTPVKQVGSLLLMGMRD